MTVFLSKLVSEPTPLAEKQPHTCMVSGCFTVDMTQADGSTHLLFSGQAFFSGAPNNQKGCSSEKMTLNQSSPILHQSVLDVFP